MAASVYQVSYSGIVLMQCGALGVVPYITGTFGRIFEIDRIALGIEADVFPYHHLLAHMMIYTVTARILSVGEVVCLDIRHYIVVYQDRVKCSLVENCAERAVAYMLYNIFAYTCIAVVVV